MGELRGYIRVYSLERQGVMILYLVRCTILSKGKCNENGYLRNLLVCFENVALSLCMITLSRAC